jgi:CDP-6-deoxy-D-xylo-4-hexulose-3-dehydrase
MKDNELLKQLTEIISANPPKYLYNQNFIPGESQVLYSGPFWDHQEILAAMDSLLNGKWLVAGEKVHKFEFEFSRMFNVTYSHMVNSGSSANLVMIAGLKKHFNWEDGSEIIVSPVGFPTTIAPIVQNNLIPKFVDIEFDTLNFDINEIKKVITKNTKAIIVSPVLGNPPNLDELKEICREYNLELIGDNCDSIGTKWNNKHISEYYVAWSCSFYPAHHISTGEGGMICTDIYKLKKEFVSFSWWGRDCFCVGSANLLPCGTCGNRFDKWLDNYDGIIDHKYVFTNMGYNLKPLDMQGAIGLIQLKKFSEIDKRRKESNKRMKEIFLKYIDGIKSVKVLENADVCWFGTPIICSDKMLKDKIVAFLEANKIQTRNYFAGNILLHPGFSHLDDYSKFKNANQVLDKVFFVGAAPHYDEQVFSYVEEKLKNEWTN